MHINDKIIDTLMSIDYFCNCENNCVFDIPYGYEFVDSIIVEKNLAGIKWSNIELDEVNRLTVYLSEINRSLFDDHWNELVVEFKEKYKKILGDIIAEKALSSTHEINEIMLKSVHWDILQITMAYTFENYLKPTFYAALLKVYQQGHFPCGWRGKYPHGNMLIY